MGSLRERTWGLAAAGAVAAGVLLAYAAHIRRVFGDWDLLGDFLYRDTGMLTVATFVAAAAGVTLAAWVTLGHGRTAADMPHSHAP